MTTSIDCREEDCALSIRDTCRAAMPSRQATRLSMSSTASPSRLSFCRTGWSADATRGNYPRDSCRAACRAISRGGAIGCECSDDSAQHRSGRNGLPSHIDRRPRARSIRASRDSTRARRRLRPETPNPYRRGRARGAGRSRRGCVLYALSEQDSATGEWRNLCEPDAEGRRLGFPLGFLRRRVHCEPDFLDPDKSCFWLRGRLPSCLSARRIARGGAAVEEVAPGMDTPSNTASSGQRPARATIQLAHPAHVRSNAMP